MKKTILIIGIALIVIFLTQISWIGVQNYKGMMEKAREGNVISKIGTIKQAVSAYRGDNDDDRLPEKLEDVEKYLIGGIPQDPYTGKDTVKIVKGSTGNLAGYKEKGFIPSFITGEGGWIYFPETGDVFLNLKGKNRRGMLYWRLGQW